MKKFINAFINLRKEGTGCRLFKRTGCRLSLLGCIFLLCFHTVEAQVTLTYPGGNTSTASFCKSNTNTITPTLNPANSTGIFSVTSPPSPSGFTINSATGAFTPSANPTGTFVISFVDTPGTTTTLYILNIDAAVTANISYSSTNYCVDGADPGPTITGTSGGTFTVNPTSVTIDANTGVLDLSSANTGTTYTITYSVTSPNGICTASDTYGTTISAAPDATFSYSKPSYCKGDSNDPTPAASSGNDSFAASPNTTGSMLDLNTNTGAIDLSDSDPGIYTVTRTLTENGCTSVFSTSVEVQDDDMAVFSYLGGPFCKGTTNPLPTFVAGSVQGGSFSEPSTNMVQFINQTTGQVDLAATPKGNYTIQYDSPGTCPTTFTNTMVIEDSAARPDISIAGICQNQALPALTINSTINNLIWFSAITPTTTLLTPAPSATPLSSELGFDNTTVGAQTVWVVDSVAGCKSGFKAVTLNVGTLPTITLSTPTNPACSGEDVTFFATGGSSYEFFVNGNSMQTGSSGFFTTNSLSNNDVVSVQGTLSGCTNAAPTPITMTINPGTAITLNGSFPFPIANTSVPVNLNPLITTNPTTGTGVFFSSHPLGGVSFQSGNYIFDPSLFSPGTTVTVVYRHIAINGCVNERSLNFDINSTIPSDTLIKNLSSATQPAFIRNGDKFCKNDQAVVLEVNSNSNPSNLPICGLAVYDSQQGRYLIGVNEDPISSGPMAGQFNFDPSILSVGTHFIVVFFNFGVCDATTSNNFLFGLVRIEIKPIPATPTISDPATPFCEGSVNDSISILNYQLGTSYIFKRDTASGISRTITDPFFYTGDSMSTAGTYPIYVTSLLDGCTTGRFDSTSILIRPIPPAPTVTQNITVCQNDLLDSILVQGNPGATFLWYDGIGALIQSTQNSFFRPPVSTTDSGTTSFFVEQNIFSTPGFAGCTSATRAQADVRVNAAPPIPVLDTTLIAVCQNQTPAAFLVRNSGQTDTLKWWSNGGLTNQIGTGNNFIPPSPTNLPTNFTYFVTQTSQLGCRSQANTVRVIVNALPNVSFSGLDSIRCTGDGTRALLSATYPPTAGTLADFSIFAAGSPTPLTGPITGNLFNPDVAGAGTFDVIYSFTDLNGCANRDSQQVVIYPTPTAGFTASGNCAGDLLVLTDTSRFLATGSGPSDSIVNWVWDYFTFRDDSSGAVTSNIIPNSGFIEVTLQVTSNNNCSAIAGPTNIFIGSNPLPEFTWKQTCEGATTLFEGVATVLRSDERIDSWSWNFGNGWQANFGTLIGDTLIKASNTFAPGEYDVKLAVNSGRSGIANVCGDTVTHRLYIHPRIKVSPLADSLETFDLTPGGWLPEPSNEDSTFTWKWGRPAGNLIKVPTSSTSNVWTTNLAGTYKAGENAWVNSPCFDLTELNRPMISLDIWSNTPEGRDGAVLQASNDDGKTWKIVGEFGNGKTTGLEWYNQSTISAKPGDQDFGQGWSGVDTFWRTARHKLDAFVGDESVRFRVAFASDKKHRVNGADRNFDGFAFDNVFIGDRKKTLLLEHFTNQNDTSSTGDLRAGYRLFNQFNNPLDIIPIQYHVAFPVAGDSYNLLNADDPEARAFQYGVSDIGRVAVNGNEYYSIRALANDQNTVDLRALSDPVFSIDSLKSQIVGDSLVASAIFTANKDPYPGEEVFVHFAVIEDSINGGQLQSVLRKLLPNNGGQVFRDNDWQTDSKDTMRVSWFLDPTKFVDMNRLKVVAFVQEKGFNEVYQAETTREKPAGIRVNTAVDPKQILQPVSLTVFPNPSSGKFTVRFEGKYPIAYRWMLTDIRGQVIKRGEEFGGVDQFEVDSGEVADGIYLLHIYADKRSVGHKKIYLFKK